MKILRLFDSLKFIVVAVVCIFILNVAHADDTNCVNYTSATGTLTQNGTPTPTNPIEPVFYTQNEMVLRAVGDVADSYDATTGKITRRVGVKVLDGTEEWTEVTTSTGVHRYRFKPTEAPKLDGSRGHCISTHFFDIGGATVQDVGGVFSSTIYLYFIPNQDVDTVAKWTAFLADQYAAGNPVIVVYPLETPVTEDWPSRQCETIKIATTHYNETKFAPVESRLDTAVAAVDTVVTQTMSQAQAIDTIATTKQTRPNEGCTAKYCLLVEDEDGTPHWYPIAGANGVAHALPAGYTELQYIESTGTQYIDTGVNIGENIQTKVKFGKTTNSFSKFGFVIGGGGHYQGLVTRTSENSYYMSMYSSSQNTVTITIPDNVFEITFNTQGHKVILNNTASYNLVLLSPYEINNTIGIFRTPGGSSTNNGIGKVYSFVITDNLTNYILFNGIPARRDSDGVLGMYDLADSNPATAFHTNAGTDDFIAGPDM